MRKINKILIVEVITVLMFALTGCGKTTVKLNDYMVFTADGYDSMGNVKCKFDYDSFSQAYKGKVKLVNEKNASKELGLFVGESAERLLVDLCVGWDVDKTSGLSNGDVVTVKWDCDDSTAEEYFNVKFDCSDVTYTVSELKEVGQFDPFDCVEITFDGISPNGRIIITPNYDQSEMQYITFKSDKEEGLKVGDSVTVTAEISGSVDSFVENYGKVLGKTEEKYTVDGLPRFISDISEIPEDFYNKMDKQLQDNFSAHMANHWSSQASATMKLIGNYMVTLKEGMNETPNNYVYYVYQINYSDEELEDYKYYWYGWFEDVMILPDGTCTVDLSNYRVSESSLDFFGGKNGDYLEPRHGIYVAGFTDIDTLFNKQIVSKIENYEYKQTIQE